MNVCFAGGQVGKSLTHKTPCAFIREFVVKELTERKELYGGKEKRDLKKAMSQHELEWELPFNVSGQYLTIVSQYLTIGFQLLTIGDQKRHAEEKESGRGRSRKDDNSSNR